MAAEDLETLFALAGSAAAVERELESGSGGVRLTEFRLLRILERAPEGGMRPGDVAKAAFLTPSGLSRAMRRLTEAGAVDRNRDPRDGRAAAIRLTATGRALLEEASTRAESAAGRLLRRLSVGQRKQLERLLGDIG